MLKYVLEFLGSVVYEGEYIMCKINSHIVLRQVAYQT